jgi:phosphoribosylformylglycinamidine synthase PurS subunit
MLLYNDRRMKAKVIIRLKEGILDPQGKTVEHALHSLGFSSVSGVRIGKFIEMELDGGKKDVDEMCRKLLANPITEDFEIQLQDKE